MAGKKIKIVVFKWSLKKMLKNRVPVYNAFNPFGKVYIFQNR